MVDDEPAIRRALCRYLTLRGCVTEQAGDGLAALLLLREKEFDAVVSDVKMPRLDGAALWLKASAEIPTLKDRFIFVSARPLPGILAQAGVPHLAKPFHLDELWAALRPVVDGGGAPSFTPSPPPSA